VTKAGRFWLDGTILAGPEDYLTSPAFDERMEQIKAGRCTVFIYALQHGSDYGKALLISLQTDYAAWRGMQQFNQSRGLTDDLCPSV